MARSEVACPTPWKIGWMSRREAATQPDRSNSRRQPLKGQLIPYLCQCGLWHTTSMSKADKRRIRREQRRRAKQNGQ